MKNLLKMGLVVPVLVLALAFAGMAAVADQDDANTDLNRDLNSELNRTDSGRDRSNQTEDSTTEAASDSADADEINLGINRRGGVDRRDRQATRDSVSLASDKTKWWGSGSGSDNDDDDGGGMDNEDEDEDPDMSPTQPAS